MPGVGGKWTWGVGGNGMPFEYDVEGNDETLPVAPGAPEAEGTCGQEPYACDRYALGREEDLRDGRGGG
jgi:hypothetical protein